MEDVLSRAWAHVKCEKDVASHAKAQRKKEPKMIRPDRAERDEKPSQRPGMDSGNQNRRDHSHKTEDCVALKIELNELLKKDGVIHVISGGSEISGISHAAVKKSTWNAKHGLEADKPKRLLLGMDEISFTTKEQEKVLTPHHDALVISLTVANCLDLGLEEIALTRRIPPLIGFSGEVEQIAGEVTLPVYAEGVNTSTKFLVVGCDSSYNMILGRPWIHGMAAVPSTLHQMVKFPAPWA
ncbi:PREDICTED: uncharacterized protein LOC106314774 [Brassica oleracea var. oleracea]|uniref:uncharacterized protein LOC106314774 n=1 Tax=Brassica oleracea var. oleracea TaxID=109376 RepID=UPI0006A6A65B|nr:PREDICTED: uncharacterized protein LOC106314774 [Brassica oleracea var. oleracea]